MKSKTTSRFWRLHDRLPTHVQELALKTYNLWRENPAHPSLEFKKLHGSKSRFSIRIGDHYRAIGHLFGDTVEWTWIGTHEEYNKLTR